MGPRFFLGLIVTWSCDEQLRFILNPFHEHQGAHSGANPMCLGRCRKMVLNNWTCPEKLPRSPSCSVNLLDLPPNRETSADNRLSACAYASNRSSWFGVVSTSDLHAINPLISSSLSTIRRCSSTRSCALTGGCFVPFPLWLWQYVRKSDIAGVRLE